MTRVLNNKMELNLNTAVFGSFTLYSAGLVNDSIAPGLSGFFCAGSAASRITEEY